MVCMPCAVATCNAPWVFTPCHTVRAVAQAHCTALQHVTCMEARLERRKTAALKCLHGGHQRCGHTGQRRWGINARHQLLQRGRAIGQAATIT